jgi:hypothetical protein
LVLREAVLREAGMNIFGVVRGVTGGVTVALLDNKLREVYGMQDNMLLLVRAFRGTR